MSVPGPEVSISILMAFAMFIAGLAALAIPILTAVWVYRDAERRGNSSAAIWAVGSAVAWPVVLIVYLIVRPRHPVAARNTPN